MEQFIIKSLDSTLECVEVEINETQIIMEIESTRDVLECPYCGAASGKIHSKYQRRIQDLPVQGKQVMLVLNTRKIFCQNPECMHKTFSEKFDFVSSRGKKTKRLEERILITSIKLSSISASALLKKDGITISKSSICELVKKGSKNNRPRHNNQSMH